MKRLTILIFFIVNFFVAFSQTVTTVSGQFKIINIGNNGYGDYTRSLILLHEMYNGTLINNNYAIGNITAMRGSVGAFERINVVNVNTSSAYNGTSGTINSYDNNSYWKLKTCIYNGKKYLALDIPYAAAFHGEGYQFSGWTLSSGENMKCVSYEKNGSTINQSLITDIKDFTPNMNETHSVNILSVLGNVGIGTMDPKGYKLAVAGNAIAESMTVKLQSNWPDYVFEPSYKPTSLTDLETYIKANKHLPEIPPAQEMEEKGVNLGDMNAKLLQKIEELTLMLIEQNKKNDEQMQLLEQQNQALEGQAERIKRLESKVNK